jgi:hypothetical protein
MAIETGIDTAGAPTAAQAAAALEAVDGSFWGVYIGGPCNGGSGYTTARLKEYAADDIEKFLPIYVGQQDPDTCRHATLTAGQGFQDGQEAVALLREFGWAPGAPCVLDVESGAGDFDPAGAVAYADGWCVALRQAGYRPGVYGVPRYLALLQTETNRPDFIWVADFLAAGVVNHSLDPDHIPSQSVLPDTAWAGRRGWQYVGNGTVGPLQVDISAVNFTLAPAPSPLVTGTISHHPNLHTAPDPDSRVLVVLDPGTQVVVLGTSGNYVEVGVAGLDGYVFHDFVEINT